MFGRAQRPVRSRLRTRPRPTGRPIQAGGRRRSLPGLVGRSEAIALHRDLSALVHHWPVASKAVRFGYLALILHDPAVNTRLRVLNLRGRRTSSVDPRPPGRRRGTCGNPATVRRRRGELGRGQVTWNERVVRRQSMCEPLTARRRWHPGVRVQTAGRLPPRTPLPAAVANQWRWPENAWPSEVEAVVAARRARPAIPRALAVSEVIVRTATADTVPRAGEPGSADGGLRLHQPGRARGSDQHHACAPPGPGRTLLSTSTSRSKTTRPAGGDPRPLVTSRLTGRRWPRLFERIESYMPSICWLPLTTARRRLGALVFGSKRPGATTERTSGSSNALPTRWRWPSRTP